MSRAWALVSLCVCAMSNVAGAADGAGPWTTTVAGEECFAPTDLRATPDERIVHKGVHAFDRPPPSQDFAAVSTVAPPLRGAIRRVTLPPGKKLIALTFDLCEQPGEVAGYDGDIVDYLRKEGVKATFFAGGKWLRSHAERAKQLMVDPLFEVGNHSEAHRNLRLLSGQTLQDEIAGPERAYESLWAEIATRQCRPPKSVPARMTLFRFPYGACNPASLDAVNKRGLLAIQWDLSTGDPSPAQSARAIATAMLAATPGSILISHANGRGHHTREALPIAIPGLRAKGFEFVTVSELIAAGTPQVVAQCYDSRPGDTDRYDHPLGLKTKP